MTHSKVDDFAADQTEYASAIALVQQTGRSLSSVARESGLSSSQLKRLIVLSEANGDPEHAGRAADDRIAEAAQTISILAAEKIIERLESDGDDLKPGELVRVYRSAVETVAQKRRWNYGGSGIPSESGVSAMRALLEEGDITISKRVPDTEVIDITQ